MKQTIERTYGESGLPPDTVLNAIKDANTLKILTASGYQPRVLSVVIDNGDITVTIAN